jgi:hypothetical protein
VGLRCPLQSTAGCTLLAEAGADDDCRARSASARVGDHPGDGLGWRSDDREVWNLRQARDVTMDRHAVNRQVVRVDQHQRPPEGAAPQVAGEHGTE